MKSHLLIFSLLLFLLLSCDGNEDSKQPEFIQLAQKDMSFDYKQGKDTIRLQANTSWVIETIPEWLTVSKLKGTKEDSDIILTVQANGDEKVREFELIFKIKDQIQTLHILQEAKPKVEYSLPRLGFSSINSLISGTYSETAPFDLEFDASNLFINDKNKGLVFPGSLFVGNLTNYPNLETINGYTYNPITFMIGSLTDFSTEKDFMPSYKAYQLKEKAAIDKFQSNFSLSLTASNGEYYYSRRHLHCIGLYELGISLETLLNGKSYKEETMKHEFGLIYPLSHVRFNAVMDMPTTSLLTEELSKEKFAALKPNYISSINYGSNSLLLVESDFDKGTVNSIKSKLSNNESLTAEETAKAEQIDAYYLYLVAAGEFKVIKGNLPQVLKGLKSVEPSIVPLSFAFSDYFANGVGSVKYKVHID